MLTEAVRRRPYQVVLVDEVEKAHREVTNILLQVFDEGHLTDAQGHKVDFRNTIFILTSNLGAQQAQAQTLGLPREEAVEQSRSIMTETVNSYFPPEFINRLDEVVCFNALAPEDMAPIVDIQLRGIADLLKDRRIELDMTEGARAWLSDTGYDPLLGARPLKRAMNRYILNPMSVALIKGDIQEDQLVTIDLDPSRPDQLQFTGQPKPLDLAYNGSVSSPEPKSDDGVEEAQIISS